MGGLVVAQQYTINTVAGIPQVPGLFPYPVASPATGAVAAPAVGPSGGQLYHPSVVATDSKGNFYVGDSYTYTVRMVNLSTGNISIIAGNGTPGNAGDKALATSANITDVHGIAVDNSGQVFFSDTSTCRIRRVDNPITTTQPFIWTAAGNTAVPFCGATSGSPFVSPGALAFDSKGNLYIADYGASVVRMMTNTGAVSTFAGTGTYGSTGDGGPASKAELAYPVSLTFDAAGNLYIGDSGNSNIRKVDTSGNITTVVSNITPQGIGIDAAGYFYYVDGVTSTVRKVLPGGGVVTVAGNGSPGYAGDGGPGSQAVLNQASGLNIDPHGIIYVADTMNDIIRSLVPVPSSVGIQDTASEVPGSALEIGGIAPGEILTLFGSGLGPATLTQATAANGVYPTQLAGTSVTFNGTPAPVIYTSSGLVTVVAPYEITGSSSANIALTYQGSTYTATMPVVAVQPAMFTANASGIGQAAALNQDLSVNSAANPAHLGSTIVLYVNGAGYTNNPVDGQVAPVNCGTSCLASPLGQVTVKIGNQFVTPSYAGAAPSLIAGVMQVNVQIPTTIIPGSVPVLVTVNGYPSQSAVNIAVIP